MDILPQLLINALVTGSIYALVSVGFSLGFSLLRIFNFAQGHLMMIGAYTFYFLNEELKLSFAPAAVGTLLIMTFFSICSFRVFIAPFYRLNFLLPIVTTIALSTILESFIAMKFGVTVRSLPSELSSMRFEKFGVIVTAVELIIISATIIILSFSAFVIHSSSIGRQIRALAQQPEASASLGINETKVVIAVFTVGILLASFAGVSLGYYTNLQPTMGNQYTLRAFASMILGGLGNIWGTVLGAYVLALIEHLSLGLDFGAFSIPPGYKDAFAFFIIIFVLLVRPQGLFSKKGRTV